ncbi:MAG: hypothetical protein DHS80DRAFT_17442 [Piptocephalis tieghemiana]|nr:MAG: hypothetical protein DHS80DRAFT_17442 [Piptocephalis tieghemiana]
MALSSEIKARLATATSLEDFKKLSKDLEVTTHADLLGEYVDYAFSHLPLVPSRNALDALLSQYIYMEPEMRTVLARVFEGHLSVHGHNYADQASNLYRAQASLYEEREEWDKAAERILQVPLDSNHRTVGDEERMSHYTHLMRLFLEDGNVTQAQIYLNKASALLTSHLPPSLTLTFTLYKARILDLTGRYLDAAFRYRDLSHEASLDPESRYQSLSRSVLCAILAPAGDKRSRILSSLYRDERVVTFPYYEALTYVVQDRILRPAQIDSLSLAMVPHHVSKGKDGRSSLDHAVLEHNILALSRIYHSLTFTSLGLWLGVGAVEAEGLASRMIREGRVNARIHQVEGMMRILPKDSPSSHPIPSTKEFRLSQMCIETEAAAHRLAQLDTFSAAPVKEEALVPMDEAERGMAFI